MFISILWVTFEAWIRLSSLTIIDNSAALTSSGSFWPPSAPSCLSDCLWSWILSQWFDSSHRTNVTGGNTAGSSGSGSIYYRNLPVSGRYWCAWLLWAWSRPLSNSKALGLLGPVLLCALWLQSRATCHSSWRPEFWQASSKFTALLVSSKIFLHFICSLDTCILRSAGDRDQLGTFWRKIKKIGPT